MRLRPRPDAGLQMDFALDTNEKKDVARKMIQMTMAVNADYLKDVGEAAKKERVTCFTCHHGEENAGPGSGRGLGARQLHADSSGPDGAGARRWPRRSGCTAGGAPPAAPPAN